MTFSVKVAFSWPSVDRFEKKIGDLSPYVKLKVYKISANLVQRELRNVTFEVRNH